MGLAVHNFHDSKKSIPPSFIAGGGFASWLLSIMPYLEETNALALRNPEMSFYSSIHPPGAMETQVPIFLCPSQRSPPQIGAPETRTRNGVSVTRAGSLADYAICGGDGTYRDTNGVIQTIPANQSNMRYYQGGPGGAPGAASDTGITYVITGTFPEERLIGYKLFRNFKTIEDGLSHTLLIGEKHIHPDHYGDPNWGDNTFFNDDFSQSHGRVVGPGFPIASSPTDPTFDLTGGASTVGRYHYKVFGSAHAGGICQFVYCDGSVHALTPVANTTVLGYLANRYDGHTISDSDL